MAAEGLSGGILGAAVAGPEEPAPSSPEGGVEEVKNAAVDAMMSAYEAKDNASFGTALAAFVRAVMSSEESGEV